MPRRNHLQLFAHEFGNHLPVNPLCLRPLDGIVGDFYDELHSEPLAALVHEAYQM